jgi:hypothetical protein
VPELNLEASAQPDIGQCRVTVGKLATYTVIIGTNDPIDISLRNF